MPSVFSKNIFWPSFDLSVSFGGKVFYFEMATSSLMGQVSFLTAEFSGLAGNNLPVNSIYKKYNLKGLTSRDLKVTTDLKPGYAFILCTAVKS